MKLDAKELQKPLAELKEQAEVEQTAYEQEQAEQQEAEDVMAEIDGLADLDYQVSALESSQKAIQTARTHYDQCSQSVQARITNYDALKQAEKQIKKTAKLDEEYQKQAEPVIKGIQVLGTVTLNSKSQLDQLTAQYKALPKDCQAYVTNYDTLKAGNASYEKLKKQYDADQKAAAEKAAAQKAQQSKKNSSSGWESSSGNVPRPFIPVLWPSLGNPVAAKIAVSDRIQSSKKDTSKEVSFFTLWRTFAILRPIQMQTEEVLRCYRERRWCWGSPAGSPHTKCPTWLPP